jgi:hypothetical protein
MEPTDASAELQPIACPWCAYTDVLLKKVLHHMESAHAQRWWDLALSPRVAGTVV